MNSGQLRVGKGYIMVTVGQQGELKENITELHNNILVLFWHTQYLVEHVQTLLSTGTVGEHFPYFKTIHHKVSLDVNIVICKVDRISRYYLDMH